MSNETYDAKRAMQIIADRLATHIGSGDNAHLAVDRQHDGFMTPLMYLGLINAMGNRSQLPDGTDVFTLKPGHYEGKNLVNSSLGPNDSTTLMIDVYAFRPSDVQYVETIATTGQLLTYTVHTDSDGNINKYAPSGWAEIERYIPLWEGNISDTKTKAVLTDTVNKYKYLRITTDNQNGSIKKTVVKNQREITIDDSYVTADQKGIIIFSIRLFVVDKNVTMQFSHGCDVSAAGVHPNGGKDISLLKIEGIM